MSARGIIPTFWIMSVILFFYILFYSGILMSAYPQITTDEIKSEGKDREVTAELSDTIRGAFENAIKNVDENRLAQQELLIHDLTEKFKSALSEWISRENREMESETGKLINQNWETLPRFGPRVHYDYYLRGYEFLEMDVDIVKTESLIVPYKGSLIALEVLYAEREHPPATSYRERFLYTVTTPIKVYFDYKDERFIFTYVEKGKISFEEGWNEEVLNRVRW